MIKSYIVISDKKYAFKSLFNDFYAAQVLFAMKILSSKHDAEDVVQEVFLSIWKSKISFKSEISFKAYLYLSTRNKCIDYIRKRRVKNEGLDTNMISQEEIDIIVKNEAYSLLYKAIEKLPPQSKKIILHSLSGMSVQEVADTLNISVNTVKSLKLRAYRTLRELYGDIFLILITSIILKP